MALSNTSIKNIATRSKPYKVFDERGLYLQVEPSGGKLWRLKYRFDGKEKKLSLGRYPETGLKEARERREEARKLLGSGVDPAAQRRSERFGRASQLASSFNAVAEEYMVKKAREGQAPITLTKSKWLLGLLKAIGDRPIADISAPELLAAIRPVEAQGNFETARRMRSLSGRVFRYGIATGRCERDLSSDIRDALTAPKVSHRAAILGSDELGSLLRAIDTYGGQSSTLFALKLAPHVFVRPGELRTAEWAEIDLDQALWVIPAPKTKMRRDHQLPLSRQAVKLLRLAHKLSGKGRLVFPSTSSANRPISENTLNGAIRRMGFGPDKMTAHGFRATASTLLNESGKWNPDAIERSLAHGQNNNVRAAYHRGAYWDERVQMAQWWSDYLDRVRAGAKILKFRSR